MYKRSAMGLLIILGIAAFAVGCAEDGVRDTGMASPTPATTMTETPMTGTATIRVADIVGNMANYEGKTVTVVADVDEVVGPRAFMLDEDSPLAGGIDNDLLVLSPQASNLANLDDQWLNNKVRVTGMVRRFNVAEVEREIGWDLEPQLETRYQGTKPVLIASSIERMQ